jgi:malonate-semialdehyde dehydrogenase (acetylating)/methylmalonate-semialdehyde dehydrogenase
MFDLVQCLKRDQKLIAEIMTQEHGKTAPDSMGDVMRGLEVAEHACGTSLVING